MNYFKKIYIYLSKCVFLTYLPYRLRKEVPIDIVLMAIVKIFIQMMNMISSHVDQARFLLWQEILRMICLAHVQTE